MHFFSLAQNILLHISYLFILVFFVACNTLLSTFSIAKRKQRNQEACHQPKRCKLSERLYRAVIDIDKKSVEEILRSTPPCQLKKIINERDSEYYTPLHWCIDAYILSISNPVQQKNYLFILKRFLQNPYCDLSILDKNGKNILHWAVINKYVEGIEAIFDLLTTSGQKKKLQELINAKDKFGYQPLHYLVGDDSEAFSEKHLAILKLFLANPLCDINVKDEEALPLLYWLMLYKQSKLTKEVLASDRLETFINLVLENQLHGLVESERNSCHQHLLSLVEGVLVESILFLEYADVSRPGIIKKLETFIGLIITGYRYRLTDIKRNAYFEKLSSLSVRKILTASVWLLIDVDHSDNKKLLLERYFGLGLSDFNKKLDRWHLIPKLDFCDKTVELTQDSSKLGLENRISEVESLSPSLIAHEFETCYKKILEMDDFDKTIDI